MGFSRDYASSNATGLNDNNWHTVKVTYSKPYLSFFVDNVLTDRVASSGSYDGTLINTQDDNNVLGRSNDMYDTIGGLTEADYYTGYLRNVRFYDYAQNDNDYNIIYSYVPNFEQNDNYATYSYYKTHGKDCSQYSLFNSDLSLGVGKAPSGASAVTFEPWTNFIKQNVLMLGEPDSSFNSQPEFISLPKAEADHLKAQNGFSIMFYAEIVQGTDNNDDTQLISINYNSRPSIVVAYLSGKFRIDSFNKVSGNNLVESSTMSFPSGINQFTLTVTSSAQKLYINGTLIVNNVYTITDGIIGFPTGNDTDLWTIGESVRKGFADANEFIWPMKIYNVVTFGKELSINEINTIKCFSDNNTLSPLINTNKCAYGNTTIDVNRTITNAIVERNVQYIYNHNIKKISICPEHDATPSMLRSTRIVTNSKPANGSVDVNHLELQGSDILGGSSIHLNAAQKVIIDGSLTITGNVYNMSNNKANLAQQIIEVNNSGSAPGFQIVANNEDQGLNIIVDNSTAQNPLIMGTSVGNAANRNIAISKNAGLHIQPDGQAGVNNQNKRGTIDTHRGLDVSGTVFGIYPVGSIMMYPFQVVNSPNFNTMPGWKLCDGTALSRTTYSELFTILGTTYGVGDGTNTFNLPNFNTNYYAYGYSSNSNSTRGNSIMTNDNLTSHNHSIANRVEGNIIINNVSGNDKIFYKGSNGADISDNMLPVFKKFNSYTTQVFSDYTVNTSSTINNTNSNRHRYSHIFNIITPAGTSVCGNTTPDNVHINISDPANAITANRLNTHIHNRFSSNNALNIKDVSGTFTYNLNNTDDSNNQAYAGGNDNWLPESTQMMSIIYTGVI